MNGEVFCDGDVDGGEMDLQVITLQMIIAAFVKAFRCRCHSADLCLDARTSEDSNCNCNESFNSFPNIHLVLVCLKISFPPPLPVRAAILCTSYMTLHLLVLHRGMEFNSRVLNNNIIH